MDYVDCLYGKLSTPKELDVFINSKQMQRLKDINLSTISRYFCPYSIDSRFYHCLGAFYLSQFVPSELNTKELRLAVLFHDIGAAPFIHIADDFMPKIVGGITKLG